MPTSANYITRSAAFDSRPDAANRWWSYAAFGVSLLFALFITFVRPPAAGYFTIDEQFIADSGVFMLYGTTPRCLDWPGIPMIFVFFVLAMGQCALNLLTAASTGPLTVVGAFGIIDQTAYHYLLDRTPLLVAGRTVQLLLVFGLLFWCIRIIYRAAPEWLPTVMRLPLAVLLCFSFDVLASAPVIRPEALAYALFAAASLLVLFGHFQPHSWRLPALVLGLMALLISQRLLFVFTFPFLLGGLLLRMGFSLRRTGGVLAGLLLGTLLTMPFLLTDTFVVLKAFLGGMLMKVGAAPMPTYFNWPYILENTFHSAVGWEILLFVVGSVAFLRFYPQRSVAILLLGNLLFLILTVFHASLIYHTHTLPIRCLALFPWLYGLYWLYRVTHRMAPVYGLLALFVATNAYEGWKMLQASFVDNPVWQVVTYLKTLPDTQRVLLDPTFDNLAPRSRKTANRELNALLNPALSQVKYQRQLGAGLSANVPLALTATLSEDERLATVQRQLMTRFTPEGRFPDVYFYTEQPGFVNYFEDKATLMAGFAQGQYDYLLTFDPLPNRPPDRVFRAEAFWPPVYLYHAPTSAKP